MSLSKADDVLTFWFEDSGPADWFKKDDDFDRLISTRFGGLVQRAGDGKQDHWMDTPRSCLALVLVLDQFPRNMFRGSSRAFATDEKARQVARRGITLGYDRGYDEDECAFFYLPFEHSELMEDQNTSVGLFQALGSPEYLDYALKHRDVIERFGRFPGRNAALGRKSTPDEKKYLDTEGGF